MLILGVLISQCLLEEEKAEVEKTGDISYGTPQVSGSAGDSLRQEKQGSAAGSISALPQLEAEAIARELACDLNSDLADAVASQTRSKSATK